MPLRVSDFFRNFANELANLLRLGKKKNNSFVLLSTFRNFATDEKSTTLLINSSFVSIFSPRISRISRIWLRVVNLNEFHE